VAALGLTDEQRNALSDQDGRLALKVLGHLLGARAVVQAAPSFPLSERCVLAVGARLGYRIGQKRARKLRGRLVASGVITESGAYRQPEKRIGPSGYRVKLYRLGSTLRRTAANRRSTPPGQTHSPVGRDGSVKCPKKRRWWEHPLLGDLHGRPPPGLSRRALRRMRSADEIYMGNRE
jgi:hypothetical protein